MKHQSRQEIIIYLVVWGLLFVAPILSLYIRTINDSSLFFGWSEVFLVWQRLSVYLLLFLAHNFLLASLLTYRNKRVAYFSIITVVLIAFTFYQCSTKPKMGKRPRGHRPPMELPERHQPPHFNEPPPPPPIVGEHDVLAVVVLILMFGANLGIKGYYRSREDHKRLIELERENLEQQLEYLRYQINPHFFMNTLNNIHALVDIDPEKAKDTILKLSKIMRYVLYEGNKQNVPLSRELDFIQHYITLMRMRYTDKVRIDTDLPHETPDCQVPPLILITFIENAFKHGISYQRESFIEVKVSVENRKLHFTCRNTKAEKPNEEKGGVGLANVRKRLDLLYSHNYTLSIHDDSDIYSVGLVIPLKS